MPSQIENFANLHFDLIKDVKYLHELLIRTCFYQKISYHSFKPKEMELKALLKTKPSDFKTKEEILDFQNKVHAAFNMCKVIMQSPPMIGGLENAFVELSKHAESLIQQLQYAEHVTQEVETKTHPKVSLVDAVINTQLSVVKNRNDIDITGKLAEELMDHLMSYGKKITDFYHVIKKMCGDDTILKNLLIRANHNFAEIDYLELIQSSLEQMESTMEKIMKTYLGENSSISLSDLLRVHSQLNTALNKLIILEKIEASNPAEKEITFIASFLRLDGNYLNKQIQNIINAAKSPILEPDDAKVCHQNKRTAAEMMRTKNVNTRTLICQTLFNFRNMAMETSNNPIRDEDDEDLQRAIKASLECR